MNWLEWLFRTFAIILVAGGVKDPKMTLPILFIVICPAAAISWMTADFAKSLFTPATKSEAQPPAPRQ